MPEQMTKQDAIEYLLYMKHNVQAKSPMDIALDTAIESLKQPTIEPEVRHGRWMNTNETVWDAKEIDGKQQLDISIVSAKCSVCGRWAEQVNSFPPYMKYNFCPICGARMDATEPPEKE